MGVSSKPYQPLSFSKVNSIKEDQSQILGETNMADRGKKRKKNQEAVIQLCTEV